MLKGSQHHQGCPRYAPSICCGQHTFVCMNFSKSRPRMAEGSVSILLLSWLAM